MQQEQVWFIAESDFWVDLILNCLISGPQLLLDQQQRRLAFRKENGIWTRNDFKEHPKNFGPIAKSLDRSNAQVCFNIFKCN